MRDLASLLTLFVATLVLTACQTTSIQSAWFDPTYAGGPMKKILVVGGGSNIADRRVFEDIFAQKLRAAGVEGVPGYTVIPDDARIAEAPFTAAVQKTGAQGVLVVRLLGVDTKTQVTTTMMVGGVGWGPYWGGYGGMFGPPMYPVTQVQQYDIATVETALYDVKTSRVVWAGTTRTFNPNSVTQETPGFADLIIGQLTARGLIAGTAKK